MDPEKVRFVLHRPQSAENVGAAARALKNFGFGRLAVVAPPSWAGVPRPSGSPPAAATIGMSGRIGPAGVAVLSRARRMARRASDLLDRVEVHADLAAALAGATWTCGTTSRTLPGRPRLHPRELALEVARRSPAGEVAVVFGEERRGLSDAELELCQAVCSIPTAPAYDSMNLAQAVAVVAWELGGAPEVLAGEPATEPARHATVEALWERLRVLLGAAGFTNPQNPEHILSDFRRLLARAEPSQREVELLVAAARALERLVRVGTGR